MRIFIDPGHNHSGFNTGATGNGLKEQDITFLVAEQLSNKLKQIGIDTMLSRNAITDNLGTSTATSLTRRVTMANNYEADLFISLHCDASTNSNAKGSHICIYKVGGEAEKLAIAINPHLLTLGLDGRSKLIDERPGLAVLKSTNMPAILIEMGFITNKRDSDIQRNNQSGLADAIFNGVCDYLGISNIQTAPPNTAEHQDTTIKIDDKIIDIETKNINGSIYVPIRKLCELLGYNVAWNSKENQVVINNEIINKEESSVEDSHLSETTIPPVDLTRYYIEGTTHVVEIDPRNIFHIETQSATNKTSYANFVNSLFFMPQANGIMFPQGIAVNAGEILSNCATHNKPVATLIVKGWNQVELKYIDDISKESNVWFAVSGYGIYPEITAEKEGFVGNFSDVLRKTNRPIIGYRKADNKIVIAVRAESDAERAHITAKNLGLDFAISLDAGGSTTLKVNGEYKFKGDGRQLWGGIIWS